MDVSLSDAASSPQDAKFCRTAQRSDLTYRALVSQRSIAPVALIMVGCVAAPRSHPIPSVDDATVREYSRALFAAYDRDDADAFAELAAEGFVLFDNLREFDGSYIEGRLRARRTQHEPPRGRTCRDDSIARGRGFVVYTAECVEQWKSDGTTSERTGWNTVVWLRDDRSWRAAHWNWKPGGVDAERAMWNDTFEKGIGFEHAPNKLLVETVRGRPPGTAIDLMTGQGRNALYLASQGWKTTGVDISDVGLRAGANAARAMGLAVELVQTNVDTYDLGVERWDLVTMIYAGNDPALIARAKAATRPGGLFVVEFFLRDDGPMGFARGELAARFTDWTILRDDIVEDVADWSKQRTMLVRFVAQKPTH